MATAVEYGLIAALIGVAGITAIGFSGDGLQASLDESKQATAPVVARQPIPARQITCRDGIRSRLLSSGSTIAWCVEDGAPVTAAPISP